MSLIPAILSWIIVFVVGYLVGRYIDQLKAVKLLFDNRRVIP